MRWERLFERASAYETTTDEIEQVLASQRNEKREDDE